MSKLKCIQKKFSKLFIFNEIQILNGNLNVSVLERILNHRFMNNFVLNFSLFKTPNLRKLIEIRFPSNNIYKLCKAT